MRIVCKKCGWTVEEKKPGRYFCTRCREYTDFFRLKNIINLRQKNKNMKRKHNELVSNS